MSGGASKRLEEPNEQRDLILPSERSWLSDFISMSVDEAIMDIKAIKSSLFHLGDIFRTDNGKFYVVTAGKKNSSGVFYYRIQGSDGTIRVRREDEITARYGSLIKMTFDESSRLISTLDFPEPTLYAFIVTEIYIRRHENGTVRETKEEMIQISVSAAQSHRVAKVRGMMRDQLASHISAGRQDLLPVFSNLSALEKVRQIGASKNSQYHLGDVFFKDNVYYIVTAGTTVHRVTDNRVTDMFYRINGTDGSDRIFRENEIETWYGQVQRVHVDQVRSVLQALPMSIITTSTGRWILINRFFLYSESGEPRTRAVTSDLERAWFSQHEPPQPVPEMNKIPDDTDCSICCESLRGDKEVVMLNCIHFFHKQCILNHQTKSTAYSRVRCPICRTDVTKMYTDGVMRLRF